MERDPEHPTTEAEWQSRVLGTLRRVAVGLSVFDPDHPLHDHVLSLGQRGAELSAEGRRHLAEMSNLAAESATKLAELEFSTVGEVPDSCRDVLSEVREGVSELSWILWAVQTALELPEAVGDPPGRPGEILIRCAARASESYSASLSREGSAAPPAEKHRE